MTSAIKEAAVNRAAYLEREIQSGEQTMVRLENSIKSIRAEMLYWKTRIGLMQKELNDIRYELKGKGKRNAKSASKSRRVRV